MGSSPDDGWVPPNTTFAMQQIGGLGSIGTSSLRKVCEPASCAISAVYDAVVPSVSKASLLGRRYWVRTSDFFGVNPARLSLRRPLTLGGSAGASRLVRSPAGALSGS
jgi:hypothetical protein